MMNNLSANYERILEVLRKISDEQLLPYQRRKPKLSDLELISSSLTAGFLGLDSEHDLFRKLPDTISLKIERSVYSKGKRRFADHSNTIRLRLASCFNMYGDYFFVDSMPLEVCKLSWSSRSKVATPKGYGQQAWVFRKKGKRIDALFSLLFDQFMIRRNYVKTFEGFKTRILANITALTTIQYINRFNRKINNIKISII